MNSLAAEINELDFPERSKHFTKFIQALKESTGVGDSEELKAAVRLLVDPQLSFTQLQQLHRLLSEIKKHSERSAQVLKVALLGSGNLHQMVWLVELFLFYCGIESEIYEGPYRDYAREILDQSSVLHQFKPDVLLLLTDHRDIGNHSFLADTPVDQLVEIELQNWLKLWSAIEQQLQCLCIQNNFDYFPDNTLGNVSFSIPGSRSNFIDLLNFRIKQEKPAKLFFHDLRNLVNDIGKRKWYDRRFYYHSKFVCTPEVLPQYSYSVTSILNAIYGRPRKCLVLDLDNTLWGGIIGDDGIEGIQIGQGSAVGEAYLDFQRYILSLKQQGVLLAVCSKNQPDVAREPFLKHPDMLIRLDDVVCFEANWDDKVSNLQTIAGKLNIGTDSMVFLDDNPTERMLVRKFLPEVAVPYLPADPSDFIPALECYRFFESVSLTQEDLMKTEQYKSEEKRKELLVRTNHDLDEYLKQLDIRAKINEFRAVDLTRIQQLLSKTNQFNLTGKRYTISELEQIMGDERMVALSLRAKDKFADYGLVSVLIATRNGISMEINSWVMSCRVFSRGLEKYFFNQLYRVAQETGMKNIRGFYIPTKRNVIVESLYADLGFDRSETNDLNHRAFESAVSSTWRPFDTFIQEDSK